MMTKVLNHHLRSGRLVGLLLLCSALAACQPAVDVAPGLDAKNANDIQALFIQNGIKAERTDTKDGVKLTVKQADLPRALMVMRAAGLPRERPASLGEVFRKEGMVSTPLEERVRYLYGLSQELERTLLQIDGVLIARVHVVLPDRVSPGDPLNPSSASVFIKYRPGTQIDQAAPRIVQLVADSIPGLSDSATSKISLVTLPADVIDAAPVQPDTRGSHWWLVLIMAVLGGGIAAVVAWALGQRKQQTTQPVVSTRSTSAVLTQGA